MKKIVFVTFQHTIFNQTSFRNQPINFIHYKFDFYYGKEAEQFSFYRIPKLLFTDSRFSKVSIEAKVLYGLMLDRMSLSIKNGWVDEENRVYIYFKVSDAMEYMIIMHPQLKLELKQIISNYVQLVDKRIYGIDRHRAMELMNDINKYICLYCESGIYSMEGSYETILLRDEYLKKQISEIGYDKYRNMNMDIISLK